MRLRALRVHDLRRFAGRGVAIEGISDGLNIFSEPNETGKSTLFDALIALAFLKHSSGDRQARALRPYETVWDAAAPLVEADLEIDGRLYTARKRFLSRPLATVHDASGREVARADSAHRWIAEAFGGGAERGDARGPAGLLWVRQGSSEPLAKDDESASARQEALGAAMEDEIGHMTGGRRMAEIRARVDAEIAELETPSGRPRKGGALAEAVDRAAALSSERDRLGAEMARLEADMQARSRALAEREGLSDPANLAEEAAALAAAEARRSELAERAAWREAAGARRAAAEARLSEAETAISRLDDQRAARAQAAAASEAARQALALAAEDLAKAQEAASLASAALDEAEAGLAVLRRRRERAGLRERLDAAEREATALAARVAEAEGLSQERRETAAARDAIPVGEREMAALERLDRAAREAAQARDMAGITVVARYAPDAAEIRLDGVPLAEGERRAAGGRAVLELPGLGLVELASGAAGLGDADRAAREAAARLAAALGDLGIGSLEAAAGASGERRRLDQRLREIDAALGAVAPEGAERLAALAAEARHRVAEIGAAAGEAAADPEEEQGGIQAPDQAGLAAAEAALVDAKAADGRARAARERLAERSARAEAALAGAEATLETAERRLSAETAGPRDAADLSPEALAAREAGHRAQLLERRDKALAELGSLEREIAAQSALDTEIEAAEARLVRLGNAKAARMVRLGEIDIDLAAIGARLGVAEADRVAERLPEVEAAHGAAEARVARLRARLAALKRLGEALDAAVAGARARYFEPLARELTPLVHMLFGPADVEFDADRHAPGTITRGAVPDPVDALSGGTREQIAVLTRLAFARLIGAGSEPPPIVLDDALVYSDDERIEHMFDVLQTQVSRFQIIVFTCRQRAFATLAGTRLRLTEFDPAD